MPDQSSVSGLMQKICGGFTGNKGFARIMKGHDSYKVISYAHQNRIEQNAKLS